MTHTPDFAPFKARMEAEGLPEIAVRTFEFYYGLLAEGHTGLIPESTLQAAEGIPDADALDPALAEAGRAALSRAVIIKLNGGLGTSMGLDKAKSLLVVKEGLSFLDVIAHQASTSRVPLVLMDSFNTRDDSLHLLRSRHPGLGGDLPLDFMQHKVPKIAVDGLAPAAWPDEPRLEWCPPGHGDLYTALVTSGMLDTLLDRGRDLAFVSNADNLGAVLDPTILGHFVHADLPFMMEVADRTLVDKKGGHLARRPDGQLILRERAQCPAEDLLAFEDIERHRHFNTNSLWLDLRALKKTLEARGHVLGLPMIRNLKTLDPRRADSPPVYQLETAMGSAIAVFEGAGALRVPRGRFAPVKTCQDLLRVRSDAFTLTDDHRVVPNPDCDTDHQEIALDDAFYQKIDDLEARFPHGPPSLAACRALRIEGDVRFGARIEVRGEVSLINRTGQPVSIEDDAVLDGARTWP